LFKLHAKHFKEIYYKLSKEQQSTLTGIQKRLQIVTCCW